MNPLYLYRARCVLYHKLATKIAETASFQKKKILEKSSTPVETNI